MSLVLIKQYKWITVDTFCKASFGMDIVKVYVDSGDGGLVGYRQSREASARVSRLGRCSGVIGWQLHAQDNEQSAR